MLNFTTVETEQVHAARVAAERFTAGRAVGFELAAVTSEHPEIADAFLLDLADGPEYTSASDADWDFYLDR